MDKKIIFHENFYQTYSSDPAADSGRMESIIEALADFELIKPPFATVDDILLVHTEDHLARVKFSRDPVYEIALLAVGGAILAAELALKREPLFAAIRPPGHHASQTVFGVFAGSIILQLQLKSYF